MSRNLVRIVPGAVSIAQPIAFGEQNKMRITAWQRYYFLTNYPGIGIIYYVKYIQHIRT